MAAAAPRLGLHNQPDVPKHRMRSVMSRGVQYYVGSNGVCFRVVRTLSAALAGHVILVRVARQVQRPDGTSEFEETGEQRAIKRLVKYNLERKISLDGRRISEDPILEIGAMAYLSQTAHQNVLRLFNVYEDDAHLFLEMECLGGGDLFEAVQTSPGGRFAEARAKKVLRELLQGLCFMHGRGIIHRDLSLENTMLTDGDAPTAKIIDLGLCVDRWAHAPGDLPRMGSVGKAAYMAPEIYLDAPFSEASDVWCLGVMLFMMLFGVPPYRKPHADLCALFREIEAGRLPDLVRRWGMGDVVSAEGQDLLRRMLTVDAAARPTIPEIIGHPWMAGEMAALGGGAAAAQQANLILEVGRRVNARFQAERERTAAAEAARAEASAAGGFGSGGGFGGGGGGGFGSGGGFGGGGAARASASLSSSSGVG